MLPYSEMRFTALVTKSNGEEGLTKSELKIKARVS